MHGAAELSRGVTRQMQKLSEPLVLGVQVCGLIFLYKVDAGLLKAGL